MTFRAPAKMGILERVPCAENFQFRPNAQSFCRYDLLIGYDRFFLRTPCCETIQGLGYPPLSAS